MKLKRPILKFSIAFPCLLVCVGIAINQVSTYLRHRTNEADMLAHTAYLRSRFINFRPAGKGMTLSDTQEGASESMVLHLGWK